MDNYEMEEIRKDIIGNDLVFDTPFGKRHLLYADYTASGRGLKRIEAKITEIMRSYANTHTEDDYSGKYLTRLLHEAENKIKKLVNAGEKGKIIASGSGATGALKKLQEIIGVYMPPATKDRIQSYLSSLFPSKQDITGQIEKIKPVVFIGPYEHHSNELMWREAFSDVCVINLNQDEMLDLKDLENKLTDKKYADRLKIGSFSAGSNITGIRTQVYDVARICHAHGALVFFDFAAVAPYVEINMNKDEESYFDAIFFSPHKFLGGPGTSGILIFNENIYRKDLPPTAAGGGTVTYVGSSGHDFSLDIETREKAGTPPILQTIKAAFVLDLKYKIGVDTIEEIETGHAGYFINELKKIKNVLLLGNVAADKRVPIISFNIKHKDRILHPKFVTRLMNDLFGLQSRAGCSCAGPYGHVLLEIDDATSERLRQLVARGYEALKPGWVRMNIHYTLSQKDVEFILSVIAFIAEYGHLFLKKYSLKMETGEWIHIDFKEKYHDFSVDSDFKTERIDLLNLENMREEWFKEAKAVVVELQRIPELPFYEDITAVEKLKNFYYYHRVF
ncbi:MAG: aminotransferase class V-fold PLP-dependent enzyme [Candidatus Aminicenantes bacterium]|nr:aminotransferase class V-fold PLP-dependent enzyme [Candidatus Aminicenantes bacterium]